MPAIASVRRIGDQLVDISFSGLDKDAPEELHRLLPFYVGPDVRSELVEDGRIIRCHTPFFITRDQLELLRGQFMKAAKRANIGLTIQTPN